MTGDRRSSVERPQEYPTPADQPKSLPPCDFGALFGSFGLFFTLFLLYIRLLPAISIAEVKPVLSVGREGDAHGHH